MKLNKLKEKKNIRATNKITIMDYELKLKFHLGGIFLFKETR